MGAHHSRLEASSLARKLAASSSFRVATGRSASAWGRRLWMVALAGEPLLNTATDGDSRRKRHSEVAP